MMRVLIDTNIILDVLFDRQPFVEDAVQEAVARQAGVDAIITRNLADYIHSAFRLMTAGDIIRKLEPGIKEE